MASNRSVWYVLVDEEGKAYKKTPANFVKISAKYFSAHLKKAVHAKDPNIFAGIDAAQLKVYSNKAAFDGKREPLDVKQKIGYLLGNTDELCVVVPSHAVVAASDGFESAPKKLNLCLNQPISCLQICPNG
ncbi:hypothetical protein AC1031_001227 [Aphanomyces cochlioides]|nr:hypothetical protein AC1031_001227 [Aphanomyces cochlioides]